MHESDRSHAYAAAVGCMKVGVQKQQWRRQVGVVQVGVG
jgi:hypothetical protein